MCDELNVNIYFPDSYLVLYGIETYGKYSLGIAVIRWIYIYIYTVFTLVRQRMAGFVDGRTPYLLLYRTYDVWVGSAWASIKTHRHSHGFGLKLHVYNATKRFKFTHTDSELNRLHIGLCGRDMDESDDDFISCTSAPASHKVPSVPSTTLYST